MMKRIISLVIITFFAFSIVSCKKGKEKADTVERNGLVNFVNGTVKLITAAGAESAAKIGDKIVQGMKIKSVGDKSFADIYFGENAIKILGNTEIEVKKLLTNLATNGDESEFFVGKGKMFSKITSKLSKSDSYKIKTPTSTAGVRGTQFLVKEEKGKANIACLEGQLEILNNSMPKSPVTVEADKECDIESDKAPMVKKLTDENKMLMQDIVKGIQAMREDIRRRMEEDREKIRKYVVDQKEKDQTLLQNQKEGDKARVEDQKRKDKENVEAIKGITKDKAEESTRAARDQMDAAKNVNKNASRDAAKSQMDSMKPKIKKMEIKKQSIKK